MHRAHYTSFFRRLGCLRFGMQTGHIPELKCMGTMTAMIGLFKIRRLMQRTLPWVNSQPERWPFSVMSLIRDTELQSDQTWKEKIIKSLYYSVDAAEWRSKSLINECEHVYRPTQDHWVLLGSRWTHSHAGTFPLPEGAVFFTPTPVQEQRLLISRHMLAQGWSSDK